MTSMNINLMSATRGEITKATTLPSTWLGGLVTLAAFVGLPAMVMTQGSIDAGGLAMGSGLALMVIMSVVAVLATSDLQYGTARLTRWADPHRGRGFYSKVITSAVGGALVGLACGVSVLGMGLASGLIDTIDSTLLLASVGQAPVFALGCALAAAVGMLLGRAGLAVAAIILWIQLAETLLPGLPTIGEHLREWLPFMNAFMFTMPENFADPRPAALALTYFAGFCVLLIALCGALVNRRDI